MFLASGLRQPGWGILAARPAKHRSAPLFFRKKIALKRDADLGAGIRCLLEITPTLDCIRTVAHC
jgi:hypothetical protein